MDLAKLYAHTGILIKKIMIVFSLIYYSALCAQSIYQQTVSYAKALNEELCSDNKNLGYPDYNSYFGSQRTKYFFNHVTSLFFSPRTTFWNKQQFETLLQKALNNNKQQQQNSDIIPIISAQDSRLVVFGNMQGAFHSLVRCLGELIRQKVLDENLTIIQPNTSIIFLGNALGRSAYALETFTLILALIAENPHKIFYLRGSEENKQRWKFNDLAFALSVYYSGREKDIIEKKIQKFFETLPPALLTGIDRNPPYACFSPGNIPSPQLKKQNIPCDLLTIHAAICGISDEFGYRKNEGWFVGIPTNGITTWNIACPPTPTYQNLFDYYFDTFSTITFEKNIDQSTVSFYNRDIRINNRFTNVGTYCLTTEQKITPRTPLCAAYDPLIIGCTLPIVTGVDQQTIHTTMGMSLRINEQNKQGGIKHHPIKIIYLDDSYDPKLARENIHILLTKFKTNITLGSNGSPTLAAYLDQVKNNEIFVFFPVTSAPQFRDPSLTSIINLAPSYSREGSALAEFALKNLSISNIAVFYQNDIFGKSILEGAQKKFDELKKDDTILIPIAYQRKETDFSEHAKKILSLKATGIIFASTETASIELIQQIGIGPLARIVILGNSDLSSQNFKNFMKSINKPFSYIQHIPATEQSQNPFISKFKKGRALYNFPDDPFLFEGYCIADLFINAAERTTGNLTAQAIMSELEHYSTTIDSLKLKFDPTSRTMSNVLWIATNEGTPQKRLVKLST